jgi:hypothetical protein
MQNEQSTSIVVILGIYGLMDYKKNNMSTNRGKWRGNKRARVTRGSRDPKHSKRKHYIVRTANLVADIEPRIWCLSVWLVL